MEELFVPYDVALKMKAIGFNELCMAKFTSDKYLVSINWSNVWCENALTDEVYAPTFSQCFRWFREKYGLYHSIGLDGSLVDDVNCDYQIINHEQSISEIDTGFNSYEEADFACLVRLIEIAESKSE